MLEDTVEPQREDKEKYLTEDMVERFLVHMAEHLENKNSIVI